MDPLSVISGVTGLVVTVVSAAQALITLIQDLKDAPAEIRQLQEELTSLSSVLQSTELLCNTYDFRVEDATLVAAVRNCVQSNSDAMASLKATLEPFVQQGSWRRGPVRAMSWTLRKGEIKTHRSRFRDQAASLTLAVSVLNGYLTGKGHDEIRNDLAMSYEKLSAQFQTAEKGRRFKKRLESDLESVTAGGRRGSDSTSTIVGFQLNRFLESKENPRIAEEPAQMSFFGSSEEPLIVQAARACNRQLIAQLLAEGSSPTGRGTGGRTALHLAAIYDNKDIAALLLDHGADANAKDDSLQTPFNLATTGEVISVRVAAVLIDRGCAIGSFHTTILSRMDVAGDAEEFRPLIAPLAKRRLMLLHEAISMKNDAVLEILIEEGVDIEQKDKWDIPPLFHAMIHRNKSAMHILLRHGANINVYMRPRGFGNKANQEEYYSRLPSSCPGGETPLSLSPHNAWGIDYTRELLQAGADPNFIFPDEDQADDVVPVSEFKGSGLLQRICAPQFFEYAKLLVEAGADVNRQTALHGLSVLYWAISCHNMKLLRLLLEYHVNVNLTTDPSRGSLNGLHAAVEVNGVEMARILIEHGVDRAAKNFRRETPLEMAHRKRLNEMIDLLEQAP